MRSLCLIRSKTISGIIIFRVSSYERQINGLKQERDKLISISGDLKAQILTIEKTKEIEERKTKLKEFKETAGKAIAAEASNENVKESKLDKLRLEVE